MENDVYPAAVAVVTSILGNRLGNVWAGIIGVPPVDSTMSNEVMATVEPKAIAPWMLMTV